MIEVGRVSGYDVRAATLRYYIERPHVSIHLVTLVGGHVDVMPFMLEHYRSKGVDAFSVNVHLRHPDDPVGLEVRAITDAFGCAMETVVGNWLDYELSVWLASMRQYSDDWWILADQDEFHYFPDELPALLAYCDARGYDHIYGTFVDRVSSDGRFAVVDRSRPLWPQFPLGGIVSARLFGRFSPKVVAAKGRVIIGTGHHKTLNGCPCPARDAFVQVHHFKWTDGVVERQQHRAEHFRKAGVNHWTESARIVDYAEMHSMRIDTSDHQFMFARCEPGYPHWDILTSLLRARRSVSAKL